VDHVAEDERVSRRLTQAAARRAGGVEFVGDQHIVEAAALVLAGVGEEVGADLAQCPAPPAEPGALKERLLRRVPLYVKQRQRCVP
jgi:hypothetical protein